MNKREHKTIRGATIGTSVSFGTMMQNPDHGCTMSDEKSRLLQHLIGTAENDHHLIDGETTRLSGNSR